MPCRPLCMEESILSDGTSKFVDLLADGFAKSGWHAVLRADVVRASLPLSSFSMATGVKIALGRHQDRND